MQASLLSWLVHRRPPEHSVSAETLCDVGQSPNLSISSSPLVGSEGLTSARSGVLLHQPTECKTSHTPPIINANSKNRRARKRPRGPSTAECHRPSKRTTLCARSSQCRQNTRGLQSTRMSRPASTTRGKASRGFWGTCKMEWSTKLWWPTAIALPASGSSSSSGSSSGLVRASSFLIRETKASGGVARSSQKIFSRLSTYSLAGQTEKEGTSGLTKAEKAARSEAYKDLSAADRARKKSELDANLVPRVTRCRLIKLEPSSRQVAWLFRWFKDTRKTYNLAMAHLLEKKIHLQPAGGVNLGLLEAQLQKMFVSKAGVLELTRRHHRLLRTPKVPRQQAVKSVIAVFKAHFTRENKRLAMQARYPHAAAFRRAPRFCPGLKARRMCASDSISIEKVSIRLLDDNTVGLFQRMKFGGRAVFSRLKTQAGMSALLPVQCDFKVHFRHGKFYLILPSRRPPKERVPRVDQEPIAAIDPGVRVPFTVYSPTGTVVEVGTNSQRVLDKHITSIDRGRQQLRAVRSAVDLERAFGGLCRKTKRNQRRRLRRARKRRAGAEDKAKRVVRDFHYKTAHYLLRHFRTIVLPRTSSHSWRTNSLARTTKRRSMMLRHGMFAARLVQTASDYPGSRVVRCSEAYTSRQCGACGKINDQLGSSKVFTCAGCGAIADRDVHAARNILLRCLQ